MNTSIETFTGRFFDYREPDARDVDPLSIAHALGNICRYTGHCRVFYSVAAHSLLCAELARLHNLPTRIELLALVHDAHEAYVGDVNSPLKRAMNGSSDRYADIEARAELVVLEALGVAPPSASERHTVKCLDLIALKTEARVLLPSRAVGPEWYAVPEKPCEGIEVVCLQPEEGAAKWLNTYRAMMNALRGLEV